LIAEISAENTMQSIAEINAESTSNGRNSTSNGRNSSFRRNERHADQNHVAKLRTPRKINRCSRISYGGRMKDPGDYY
jgi:hypothetical protein